MATLCPDTNFNIHDPCALAMFGLFYFLFLLILIEYYHIVKLSGYKYISEKSYKIKIAYFVCFSLVLLYAGYSYYQVKQMNNHGLIKIKIIFIFIIKSISININPMFFFASAGYQGFKNLSLINF